MWVSVVFFNSHGRHVSVRGVLQLSWSSCECQWCSSTLMVVMWVSGVFCNSHGRHVSVRGVLQLSWSSYLQLFWLLCVVTNKLRTLTRHATKRKSIYSFISGVVLIKLHVRLRRKGLMEKMSLKFWNELRRRYSKDMSSTASYTNARGMHGS